VSYDGHIYGIPFSLSILGNAFYNKAIFDELGLKEPTTWEEWDQVASALKAAGHSVLTSASGPAWTFYQFYAPLLTAMGPDGYWEMARGNVSYTSPEMAKAIDLYTKSVIDNFDTMWTGAKWSDGVDRLMQGDVAVYVIGDWASGYMKQRGWTPGKDYDFFGMPGMENITIFQGDTTAVIKGDNAALGARFAAVTGTAEAQAAFNAAKGSVAPNETVDPAIYDQITRAEYDKIVAEDSILLPNLYVLTPLGLREDIGTAFERYAATKDRAALDVELARLDEVRKERLAAGEFGTW
jgi:ABC-type glycerol-3-phosphate transport system substrate-binding protein